ncbi:unnamed protein product [Sphagnum troendelagicum]|uniref:Uncharacterized protein n=1 Tax=Sphagnum troendelagicum TaxID=128251 RepID=A0ABP0UV44_9BRYO
MAAAPAPSPLAQRGKQLCRFHVLLDELENVRTEMAEIVESERGLLRETLERESASIRGQAMEVCANNGSEMMMNMLSKGDVQKRLQTERDKVLLMTDTLKREMEGLRSELGEAPVRNQSFNALT